MVLESTHWHPPAAYLYILQLNGHALAWEYLRRNREYHDDWKQRHRTGSGDTISRWGLELFEDPNRDARAVRPNWQNANGHLVKLQADDEDPDKPVSDQERFSFWAIPGIKQLMHNGRHVLLTSRIGREMLHLALGQDIRDGLSFSYVLPSGPHLQASWRAIEAHRALMTGPVPVPTTSTRPDRLALVHMRALQALDGRAAGASQREIARRVFGIDHVIANWHTDGELRAQMRHLIRRGQALMAGGYRSLISTPSSTGR